MKIIPRSLHFSFAALVILVLSFCATPLFSQTHEIVKFQVDPGNLLLGSFDAVFVSGDLPELGNNEPSQSIALTPKEDNIWEADILLPVNRDYTYQFFKRGTFFGGLDDAIGTAIGEPISASTSLVALDPANKSISYRGSLDSPILHWRHHPVEDFAITPLVADGDDWQLPTFGEANRKVEFFFTSTTAREPASLGGEPEDDPTYSTDADQIFIQGGEIFTYRPSSVISPPRRDYDLTNLTVLPSKILDEDRPLPGFPPPWI